MRRRREDRWLDGDSDGEDVEMCDREPLCDCEPLWVGESVNSVSNVFTWVCATLCGVASLLFGTAYYRS